MAKVTVLVKTADHPDEFLTAIFDSREEATEEINKKFDLYGSSHWHGTISGFFGADCGIYKVHILILEQNLGGKVTVLGHNGFTTIKTHVLVGLKDRTYF